jgi:hypothetical protein
VARLVGPEPPFHAPVFVPAHRPRASVEMEGGTTYHFVTEGIEAALRLHVVPFVAGAGERLLTRARPASS